jgi:hypothetical protein
MADTPKKSITDFSVTPDVKRLAGMKSTKEFDESVNTAQVPKAPPYSERIRQRATMKASGALKRAQVPLGHVASPPPEKMVAIANLSGMARPSFGPPEEKLTAASATKPVVKAEKPIIEGVGAAYPVNQVLSQGKTKGPVTMSEGNEIAKKQGLSKESIRALEATKQHLDEQESPEETPAVEPDAKASSMAKETRKELDEAEEEFNPTLPLMDYATLSDVRSILMSKKRRDTIESRLKPLNIGDMITKKEIVQTIPIIPGQLEVTLRTFNQRENLWILKYIYDFPGSALYIQELINTCRLVCGLVAVNGALLPDHRKDVGMPTEQIIKEDFERKFFNVSSFPVHIVADFSVQAMWFQDRVDKLFTVSELKNG